MLVKIGIGCGVFTLSNYLYRKGDSHEQNSLLENESHYKRNHGIPVVV